MMSDPQVSGQWQKFTIKVVEDSDIPSILDFLTENFYFDTQMGRKFSDDEDFVEATNEKMSTILKANPHLSLMAQNLETGDIAGVQLVFIWRKEDADAERLKRMNAGNATGQVTHQQRKMLDAIYEPMKETQLSLFERFREDKIAWNFVASTGRRYRKQGLASELYQRMIRLIKGSAIPVVFSYYISPYSRRLAEKSGFLELARTQFSQVRDGNGTLYFPQAGDDEYCSLMARKL